MQQKYDVPEMWLLINSSCHPYCILSTVDTNSWLFSSEKAFWILKWIERMQCLDFNLTREFVAFLERRMFSQKFGLWMYSFELCMYTHALLRSLLLTMGLLPFLPLHLVSYSLFSLYPLGFSTLSSPSSKDFSSFTVNIVLSNFFYLQVLLF